MILRNNLSILPWAKMECLKAFLTAASCPKKDFYTPPPPPPKKTCNRLLFCILKIARLLYCILKKVRQKAGPKRRQKRRQISNRKVAKKFIPEPVLLLSWNRSKTDLVILQIWTCFEMEKNSLGTLEVPKCILPNFGNFLKKSSAIKCLHKK